HGSVVFAGQTGFDKFDPVFDRLFVTARLGGDDRDLAGPHFDVAQQQRQDALADAAEPDNEETAGKGCVFLVEHEGAPLAGSRKRYGRSPAMSRRPGATDDPGAIRSFLNQARVFLNQARVRWRSIDELPRLCCWRWALLRASASD